MTFTIRDVLITKSAETISSEILRQNISGRGMIKTHHCVVGEIFSVTANLTQQFEFNNPNSSVTANLTQQFEFDNPRNLLNIVGFSILFLMGTIGNTVIGILSYRQTRRPENKGKFISKYVFCPIN